MESISQIIAFYRVGMPVFIALVRGEPINRLLRKLHVEKLEKSSVVYRISIYRTLTHECDRRSDRQLAF